MAGTEGENDVVVRLPEGGASARVARAIDNLVVGVAKHWPAMFNIIVGVFFALPFLAPVLMHAGLTTPANIIYLLYRPTCHQLPDRSYFLFGPQLVYSVSELETDQAVPPGLNILQREALRWEGSPALGWKVAFCERDVAIYGSILLAGLIFGVARRRYARAEHRRIPKLPLKAYGLMALPMAIDGFTQLFGLRESDWLLRTLTGALFGMASVWLAYPYIQEAMDDVRWSTVRRLSAPPGDAAPSQQAP